jgi:hypothetical protein
VRPRPDAIDELKGIAGSAIATLFEARVGVAKQGDDFYSRPAVQLVSLEEIAAHCHRRSLLSGGQSD